MGFLRFWGFRGGVGWYVRFRGYVRFGLVRLFWFVRFFFLFLFFRFLGFLGFLGWFGLTRISVYLVVLFRFLIRSPTSSRLLGCLCLRRLLGCLFLPFILTFCLNFWLFYRGWKPQIPQIFVVQLMWPILTLILFPNLPFRILVKVEFFIETDLGLG